MLNMLSKWSWPDEPSSPTCLPKLVKTKHQAAAGPPVQRQSVSLLSCQGEKEPVPFFMQTDCTVTSQTGPKAFKIPLSIRERICATFDTANAKGKDWQLLAQKLHLDRWVYECTSCGSMAGPYKAKMTFVFFLWVCKKVTVVMAEWHPSWELWEFLHMQLLFMFLQRSVI